MDKQKVKMIETLSPDLVPNGTVGVLETKHHKGLMTADFGGIKVYVYDYEIELIPDENKE